MVDGLAVSFGKTLHHITYMKSWTDFQQDYFQ